MSSENVTEKTSRISTDKIVNGITFILVGSGLYALWGLAEHKTPVEILVILIQAIALGLIVTGITEFGTFIRHSK